MLLKVTVCIYFVYKRCYDHINPPLSSLVHLFSIPANHFFFPTRSPPPTFTFSLSLSLPLSVSVYLIRAAYMNMGIGLFT